MRWSHAGLYAALAAVLAIVDRASAPPPAAPRAAAPPTPARPALDITELAVESNGRRVRLARDGDQWQVTEPGQAAVPPDLIDALLSAVLDTPAEAIAADVDRLAEFGLATPKTRITFSRREQPPVTLVLGTRNPAETGTYGRLEGSPQIVLVGLNVEYYVGLVLRAASADGSAAGQG